MWSGGWGRGGGGGGNDPNPNSKKMQKMQKIQKNDPNVCKEQAYIWPVSLAHNPRWVIVRHLRQCAHRRPDSNSELWWCTCELWYIYSKLRAKIWLWDRWHQILGRLWWCFVQQNIQCCVGYFDGYYRYFLWVLSDILMSILMIILIDISLLYLAGVR